MTNVACKHTAERFLDLEDGRLRPEDAVAVRAHLASCERCRAAWERWQAEDRLLREALRPVAPARDLAREAVARLRAVRAWRPAAPRPRVLVWGLSAAAAAAALALAVGVWAVLGPRYVQLGQVTLAEGQVMARQRGARRAKPMLAGAAIYNYDELTVGSAGRLAVELHDRSRLILGESTDVQLYGGWQRDDDDDCDLGLPHVCLHRGEVECKLESLVYFCAVGTPLGTAIVQGTKFRMRYEADKRVLLEVLEGEVLFSCPKGQVRVGPGSVWAIESTTGLPVRVEREG